MGGRPLLLGCCLLALVASLASVQAQHAAAEAHFRKAHPQARPAPAGQARLQRSSTRPGQHGSRATEQQQQPAVSSDTAAATQQAARAGAQEARLQARGDRCPRGMFFDGEDCADCADWVPEADCSADDCRPPQDCRHVACPAGYFRTEGGCQICDKGSYSKGGLVFECSKCPGHRTTSAEGSKSVDQCVCPVGGAKGPNCNECPAGKVALESGKCGCAPGHGGASCELCSPGFYSMGGNDRDSTPECKPCGAHLTSPIGAASIDYCECVEGYGADRIDVPMEDRQCVPCPFATFNPGDVTAEPLSKEQQAASVSVAAIRPAKTRKRIKGVAQILACQLCSSRNTAGGFTTLDIGSKASSQCVCKPGYGGFDCSPCAEGTYSLGGKEAVCQTCPNLGAGFSTNPKTAATSISACVCRPGFGFTDMGTCKRCAENTYSTANNREECVPCPFGTTSAPGAASKEECRRVAQLCSAGQIAPADAVSKLECACQPGYGGRGSPDEPCTLCPSGTFAPGGNLESCQPCAWGTTSRTGATSKAECKASPQACPIGQWAPEDAVSREQCVCYPGFGAGESPSDPCTICPPGSFSEGKVLEKCMPCGFGFTSAEGSTSAADCRPTNLCPAGTASISDVPLAGEAVSVEECRCKPGYGSPTGTAPCHLCPMGTWSSGGSYEDCQPCPLGLTSGPGTTSDAECVAAKTICPHGQIAPPGAVSPDQCVCQPGFGGGETPKDACHKCPEGTFGRNGTTQPCEKCPFGFSSAEGAASKEACFPHNACPLGTEVHREVEKPETLASCVCKPGFGAVPGTDYCRLCPAGTYAYGGDWSECQTCKFTLTSAPGAKSEGECVPAAQPCPIGQISPPGAVSADQCACMPGYGGGEKPTDACKLCPVNTWSPGGTTDRCVPCGFGMASPEGAVDEADCIQVDACPAGTVYREGFDLAFSLSDCVCKPGYGSESGSGVCHLCPRGTFSQGGTMEDCKPCPFGFTSDDGSIDWKECRIEAQRCPIGQWAPHDAVSARECRCYSGFGGGDTPLDACTICPRGTFSAGRGTDKCIPCPGGYTSEEGATDIHECYSEDACPAGAETIDGFDGVSGCKCKAGFGSITGQGPCERCPVGYYSEGGSNEPCVPCGFGLTSRMGAESVEECQKASQPCPVGQIAPPKAVSAEQCGCAPGFGGGATPKDACTICPAGTYSPGGDTQPCVPCGFGFSSAEGSMSEKSCVQINACPAGSMYQDGAASAFSIHDCVCKPGSGSHEHGMCRVCPRGTYSVGGTVDGCKSCGAGWTSEEGSISWHDCYQEFDGSGHAVIHSATKPKAAVATEQPSQNPTAAAAAAAAADEVVKRH